MSEFLARHHRLCINQYNECELGYLVAFGLGPKKGGCLGVANSISSLRRCATQRKDWNGTRDGTTSTSSPLAAKKSRMLFMASFEYGDGPTIIREIGSLWVSDQVLPSLSFPRSSDVGKYGIKKWGVDRKCLAAKCFSWSP